MRNEQITRDEAIYLVKKYDQEFPEKFFPEFLEYLSISEDDFWETVESFRSEHIWTKKDNSWVLKEEIK